ncbi:hypothetical protein EVAR_63068_1 [Eumeta japonica]|uniref:RNase H type-1 domain-containing protein n=1 Tax=Eumeta variegata TaxID=151549 RepID=A0A4C1Z8E7_EUMVA|nr:hypothetical protein EVAR_63068_1 [Eumeta japonica]
MHSTLILSRLLPFDIKMAWLYKAKRRKELGDNYVNRELVRPVYLGDLPHPTHVPEIRDSRSSLEILTGSKTYHPLSHEARRDISEIVAEDRAVRLFWVRAHAGIARNERNKLTERTALTKKTATTYDRFPLSHAKKIRAASLEE